MSTQVPPYDEHSPGILGRPDDLPFAISRRPPATDLAWCIERFWIVEWHLARGHPVSSRVLPHPCVNLTFEPDGLFVTGIPREIYTRQLSGQGKVVGIKFNAGAFRALHHEPAQHLLGQTMPAQEVLPDIDRLERRLRDATTEDEQVGVLQDYVREFAPQPDPTAVLVGQIVAALVSDKSVRRVADVCSRFGVGERSLQRLFAEYVGVTPRWVLSRGRLHAAAERVIELAMHGDPTGWASVALDLGYVDQAHFIRDFTRTIGTPPGRWAAEMIAAVESAQAG